MQRLVLTFTLNLRQEARIPVMDLPGWLLHEFAHEQELTERA
jgi:hypothetical protein